MPRSPATPGNGLFRAVNFVVFRWGMTDPDGDGSRSHPRSGRVQPPVSAAATAAARANSGRRVAAGFTVAGGAGTGPALGRPPPDGAEGPGRPEAHGLDPDRAGPGQLRGSPAARSAGSAGQR